jgi:flavin-dependent dehydrogenase
VSAAVLIVGGGPVGLALAIELGLRGVRCLLAEKRDGRVLQPKMSGVSARGMEFGIGDFATALGALAPANGRVVTAPDVDELWALLAPRLQRDAAILLKDSRGVKLERLLPHLTTWSGA